VRRINALLRFYFKIEPDLLSDEEWGERWGELHWVLKDVEGIIGKKKDTMMSNQRRRRK